MKKISLLILGAMLLISCENNVEPEKKISLSFNISSLQKSLSKVTKDSLQIVKKAVITLKKGEEIIYNNYDLTLINWGSDGVFRTDIIEVDANAVYSLTQFELRDSTNSTVFATPLESSPLSFLVNDPLPVDVNADVNEQKAIPIDVISTFGYTPQDFGYPYFVISDKSKLPFSVTVKANGDLVTSTLDVVSGSYSFQQELALGKNDIYIDNDFDSYNLTISKDGYEDFVQTFLYDSLYSKHLLIELIPITPEPTGNRLIWVDGETGVVDKMSNYTINNGTQVSSTAKYGTYGSRGNINDGFSITTDAALENETEDFTVEGWFYLTATVNGGGLRAVWMTDAGRNDYGGYQIVIDATNSLRFGGNANNGNPAWTFDLANSTMPVAQWTHLAFSFDYSDNEIKIFKNGVLLDSAQTNQTGNTWDLDAASKLWVAEQSAEYNFYVDDFAIIYGKAYENSFTPQQQQ